MTDRFTVEPAGNLWRVTDIETGQSFLHLSEEAAHAAAQTDITTGVTAEPIFGPAPPTDPLAEQEP